MEGWDARQGTIKEREPPREGGRTISKKRVRRERTKDYLVKGLELNLLIRDLTSNLVEEDITFIYCSKYINLLLWIQQY